CQRPQEHAHGAVFVARMNIGTHAESMLRTDFVYTGDLSHYMKVTRMDFIARGGMPAADAAEFRESRRRWAAAYTRLAGLGYQKKLDIGELEPGAPPSGRTLDLPD